MAYRVRKSRLQRYPRPLQGNARVIRGGGGGGGGRQTLGGSYQAALDRANAANEKRYQQILSGYDDLHGRVMGDLAGVGVQQGRDIDRRYRNMGSDVYQRLVNRGFGNSSLVGTMRMGVERERNEAQRRLSEGLAQQRAGFDTSITGNKLGVMERRTDLGPDPNQLIGLSRGLGQGGYGAAPIFNPGLGQSLYQRALGQHFNPMGMQFYSRPLHYKSPHQRMRYQSSRQRRRGGSAQPPNRMEDARRKAAKAMARAQEIQRNQELARASRNKMQGYWDRAHARGRKMRLNRANRQADDFLRRAEEMLRNQ